MGTEPDHFKTIANLLPERPQGWPKPQSGANSALARDQAYYLTRARILFACYRKDEAHDPEIYASAVAAVLTGYEHAIVERATDPRTGVASECKWLPTVAEIRDFCERETLRARRLSQPARPVSPSKPIAAPERKPGQYSYAEFLEMASRGEVKHRPIGRFEKRT